MIIDYYNLLNDKDAHLLRNLNSISTESTLGNFIDSINDYPETLQILFKSYTDNSTIDQTKKKYSFLLCIFNYYYKLLEDIELEQKNNRSLSIKDTKSVFNPKHIDLNGEDYDLSVNNATSEINNTLIDNHTTSDDGVSEINNTLIDTHITSDDDVSEIVNVKNLNLTENKTSFNDTPTLTKETITNNSKLIIDIYCEYISELIIKYIKSESVIANIPKNIFTGKFMQYIMNHHFFFSDYNSKNSLFRYIISNKKLIDYLDYSFNDNFNDNLKNYVIYSDLLYKELQKSLLSFALLNKTEIEICINFISLVNNYIKNETFGTCRNYELKSVLISNTIVLYTTIYLNIFKNIDYDTESLVVYNYTNDDSVLMSNLRVDSKSNIVKNTINYINFGKEFIQKLSKMKFYKNIMDNRISEFTILNIQHTSNNTVEMMPYIINTHIKNNFVPKSIIKLFTHILYSNKINIHIKSDLVIKTSHQIYQYIDDPNFLNYLVKLFNICEQYKPESGFMIKFKLRTRILNILSQNFKSNLFDNILTDEYTKFITFYVNHIISLLNKIVIIRDSIIKSRTIQYINNPSNILNIKYIIYIHSSLKFIKHILNCKHKNDECNELFNYKVTELVYSLISIFIDENLIDDLLSVNKRDIIQTKSKFLLENVLFDIISIINNLSDKDYFIQKSLDNNSSYYNEKYINTLLKIYENMDINSSIDINVNNVYLNKKYKEIIEHYGNISKKLEIDKSLSNNEQPNTNEGIKYTKEDNQNIEDNDAENITTTNDEVHDDTQNITVNDVENITTTNDEIHDDTQNIEDNDAENITTTNDEIHDDTQNIEDNDAENITTTDDDTQNIENIENINIPYNMENGEFIYENDNENNNPVNISHFNYIPTQFSTLIPLNFIQDFTKINTSLNTESNDDTVKLIEYEFDNTECMNYNDYPNNTINIVKITNILSKYKQKILDKINTGNNISIIIPDKFLDPLLFIPIKIPLEIPEVEIIVDSYTIYNHLIFSSTNPFTNNNLTKKELIDYNNLSEVKERIKKYHEDYKNWEEKQNNT